MKKYFIIFISFVLVLFATSCGMKKENNETFENDENINYSVAELRINMPLSFDDLDNYFEFSLIEKLEEDEIGEVYGDGTPYGEYGPYATDIEIEIDSNKLNELKDVISEYRFPKGSYLSIDGKIILEFGDLYGVRIVLSDSADSNLNLYESLKKYLSEKYVYCTFISLNNFDVIYFYGENLEILKEELIDYVNSKKLNDFLSISEMPDSIQE